MKVIDHLSKNNIRKLNQLKIEKLSENDLKELMGVYRDTYKRHNGAWRRK